MADEIKIELVADANGVIKAIQKTEKPATESGKKIGGAIKQGIKDAGIAAVVGASLASAAALAAAKIFADKVVEGIEAQIIQAEAVNKLNNSLATTGQFSAQASRELQNFASELQSVTRFGDEALIGQMAFAQSMGASAEQSKQIIKAATSMATALDMDLNSAVRNISKTLGGYAGELGEVIPAMKGLTKEQLQAGEGVVLLEKQFSAFAELSANTFAGRLEQLSNSYGDLKEKVGEGVVNSEFFVIAMQKSRIVLDNFIASADFTFVVRSLKSAALASVSLFESISKVALAISVVSGNEKIVSFFGSYAAAAMKLKTELHGISEADERRAQNERLSTLDKQGALIKEAELMKLRNAQSEYEEHLAKERAKANSERLKNQQLELASFRNSIKTQFVGGMVSAFSSFGKAMATGGNAFKDFGSTVLNMVGSLATQMGQFFILIGAGMSATGALLGLSGGAAIAAGVGLTVLGGVLQGMAGGGGGGGGSVATTSAGGGVVESDATLVNTAGDITGINEPESIEKQQQVQVVVQGDILDNGDETATRILNILNENFDAKGGRIAYA